MSSRMIPRPTKCMRLDISESVMNKDFAYFVPKKQCHFIGFTASRLRFSRLRQWVLRDWE